MKVHTNPGLPDGIISYQKSQFWYIWEGLGIQNVGIFSSHLVFLLPFGTFIAI
jgi:hypothetical protein